jgi:hypothetical protein
MSCQNSRILLEMAAMVDLVSMDAGCGGHLQYTFLN